MTKIAHIFCMLIMMTFSNGVFAKVKVIDCGPLFPDVKAAMDQVVPNINSILNGKYGKIDLTETEKGRFKHRMRNLRVQCVKTQGCEGKIRGYHINLRSKLFDKISTENKVFLCVNQIQKYFSCDLAGILFHEIAHAADIPMSIEHSGQTRDDKVYRLGDATTAFCKESGMPNFSLQSILGLGEGADDSSDPYVEQY